MTRQQFGSYGKKIVALLASKRPEDTDAAKRALESLEPDTALTLLLDILKQEGEKRQRWMTIGIGAMLAYLAVVVILTLMARVLDWDVPSLGPAWSLPIYISLAIRGNIGSRLERNAALAITRFEDIRAVGPLLECLSRFVKDASEPIYVALVRLLPRLQESDADLIEKHQRAALYQHLLSHFDLCVGITKRGPLYYGPTSEFSDELVAFFLAAFDALPKIGDEKAVAVVKRIATCHAITPKQEKVQEAAQACLPLLEKRVAQGAVI